MNSAPIRSEWTGRIVAGKFTLLKWLGGSEWGGVFLTELEGGGRQKAAVKLIPVDAGNAKARLACWAATAALSHPHLMRLFDAGRCEIDNAKLLYAVTEYAGEVLSEILPERPLTPRESREMLGPVLDALSYLHQKGFVHGHLKPSNVMAVDDCLKLSGDSLYVSSARARHLPALSVYDAPESAAGTISPAADVWSLGATLVEVLTQHPPAWDRSTNAEPVVPESMPQPFAGIARECLRRDPARRCTLSDIKARLEPVRSLPDPIGKTPGTAPAKLPVAAIIAAVLVLFAVIAGLEVRSHMAKPPLPTGEQLRMGSTTAGPPLAAAPETQTANGSLVKGAVAEQVLPDVLPSARESIQGTIEVGIRVTVDPGGDVSSATFESPGPSKYFARVTLEAAQHWRFKPAQMGGKAGSSIWILRFQFSQTGTEVTPVEVSP